MVWRDFPEVTGKTECRETERWVKGHMDEPCKHSAKRKYPDRKGHILYDSTYVNYPEEVNP